MKKVDFIKWANENNLKVDESIKYVERNLKRNTMSWQSLSPVMDTQLNIAKTETTEYGYRKITTGEYVSSAYRNNFGWKNTYYQKAEIKITFGSDFIKE